MKDQQVTLLIAGMFFLIGVIFALVPIILVKSRKKKALLCDCMTTATVVEYVCCHSDGSRTYAPVYSYWVNGTEYRKTSHYSSSGRKFAVGDSVVLRYNKENPTMVFVQEEQYIVKFLSVIFGLISVVMFVIGGVMGVVSFL
ncbi:MAG: DUF3592 domain-containing protein [Lachnospiraceae bacterium]